MKIHLVDGTYELFRSFYGPPPKKSPDGREVGATIGLLTIFGATALKLGRRAWVLATMLVIVYMVLFLILRSADFALLAGATLAFVALALTMWLTRNEDWHGPERPRGWPFRKAAKDTSLPAT